MGQKVQKGGLVRMHSTSVEPSAPTTILNLSGQQQDLRRETTATSATERMDDEKDERWNLVAAGCDINMLGPTVSTHDGNEWVHIDDYGGVKREVDNA